MSLSVRASVFAFSLGGNECLWDRGRLTELALLSIKVIPIGAFKSLFYGSLLMRAIYQEVIYQLCQISTTLSVQAVHTGKD